MAEESKNTQERRIKEMKSLFEDPKFSRKAFKAVGGAILCRQAQLPQIELSKDGIETSDSLIERYTYDSLAKDIRKITGDPTSGPTEIEMIMACQAVKARTNAANFVAFRDTVGAKPIDESKVEAHVNDYSGMTDEELEALAELRKGSAKIVPIVKTEE